MYTDDLPSADIDNDGIVVIPFVRPSHQLSVGLGSGINWKFDGKEWSLFWHAPNDLPSV